MDFDIWNKLRRLWSWREQVETTGSTKDIAQDLVLLTKPSQRTTTTALSHTFSGSGPEQYSVQVAVPSNVDCTLDITGTGSFNFGGDTPIGAGEFLQMGILKHGAQLVMSNEYLQDTMLASFGSHGDGLATNALSFSVEPSAQNIGRSGVHGSQPVYVLNHQGGLYGVISVLDTNMVTGVTHCVDFKMTLDIPATTSPEPTAGIIELSFALTVSYVVAGSIAGTCKLTRAE